MSSPDLFLSIHPRWSLMIRGGHKDIELRRVLPAKLKPGARVILYETGKVGAITAVADFVELLPFTAEFSERYGTRAGMWAHECKSYLAGGKRPGGIVLANVRDVAPVTRPTLVASSAGLWAGFTIPQSWRYVSREATDSVLKGVR